MVEIAEVEPGVATAVVTVAGAAVDSDVVVGVGFEESEGAVSSSLGFAGRVFADSHFGSAELRLEPMAVALGHRASCNVEVE